MGSNTRLIFNGSFRGYWLDPICQFWILEVSEKVLSSWASARIRNILLDIVYGLELECQHLLRMAEETHESSPGSSHQYGTPPIRTANRNNSFCVGGLHVAQAHVAFLSSFLHIVRSVRHAICEVSAGQPGCAERQVFEAPQHSPTVINNSSTARGGGLQVPAQ